MEPLVRLTSVVAPLLKDNVDTDTIIPAAYMRSLSTDPASGLFARWRYREDGTEDASFVLNDPRYHNARILLAGANFGCGSSRENAVWALERFGIRCVVALGFSDIFRENAFKNGVLPMQLPTDVHAWIAQAATRAEPLTLTVDVATGQFVTPSGETFGFELDERRRARLLCGADEIEETLKLARAIEAFREQHRRRAPWVYAPKPATDTERPR
jgi:3-isopropylmalate/(R)-2-methylmalate dehydratase small subunit